MCWDVLHTIKLYFACVFSVVLGRESLSIETNRQPYSIKHKCVVRQWHDTEQIIWKNIYPNMVIVPFPVRLIVLDGEDFEILSAVEKRKYQIEKFLYFYASHPLHTMCIVFHVISSFFFLPLSPSRSLFLWLYFPMSKLRDEFTCGNNSYTSFWIRINCLSLHTKEQHKFAIILVDLSTDYGG